MLKLLGDFLLIVVHTQELHVAIEDVSHARIAAAEDQIAQADNSHEPSGLVGDVKVGDILALLVFSLPFYWSATEPQAMLAQQLAVYVSERDQAEEIHRGIIEVEPVGWVTHNPFRVGRSSENPFSAE